MATSSTSSKTTTTTSTTTTTTTPYLEWPWSTAVEYYFNNFEAISKVKSDIQTLSYRNYNANHRIKLRHEGKSLPSMDIKDAQSKLSILPSAPNALNSSDPVTYDEEPNYEDCINTISSIIATKCEIDPIIQIGGIIQGQSSRLKPFTPNLSAICNLGDVESCVDTWTLFIEIQLKTLKKMKHGYYEVYEVYTFTNGETRITDLSDFIKEIETLLTRNEYDESGFQRKFRFPIKDKKTVKLFSILKIDGESVLFCSSTKIIVILDKNHRKRIDKNSGLCSKIISKMKPVNNGIHYKNFPLWSFLAYLHAFFVLLTIVYVASQNPAKRTNWFEITIDSTTVLISAIEIPILLAVAAALAGTGLQSDPASKYIAALNGCSRWVDESQIIRDISENKMNRLKEELTNSDDTKLTSIWKKGKNSFSIDRLQGQITMNKGMHYDPKYSNASIIVGERSAFNFKTLQCYTVTQKSPTQFSVHAVDRLEDNVIIGVQRDVTIS